VGPTEPAEARVEPPAPGTFPGPRPDDQLRGLAPSFLPPLTPCLPRSDGRHWIFLHRKADGSACNPLTESCDHALYGCRQAASAPVEYTAAAGDAEAEVDCTGAPLRRLSFTVAGMGGELRWNRSTCDGDKPGEVPRATLLVFSGGGGTGWRDATGLDGSSYETLGRDPDGDGAAGDNDYRALERRGVRVVAVKWQAGVLVSAWWSGWWTRPTAQPLSAWSLSSRPAAVVRFVGAHLVAPGTRFGVAGTSGGSLQSASVLWHATGVPVHYLGLHAGGGIVADLQVQCGASVSPLRVHKDTGKLCKLGDACGSGHDDPVMVGSVRAVVDYWHASTTCLQKTSSGAYTHSSLGARSWEGQIPPAVGFLVNSSPPLESDMALGAVWAAGAIRELVRKRGGKAPAWKNAPGVHGQVMQSGHPSFAAFKAQVLTNLGL
jgi:hypothetical protein